MATRSIKLLSAATRAALAVLVLAAVAVLGAVAFAEGRGYALVAVQGASMGEALPLGSIVVGERVPAAAVRRGDVVLVQQRSLRGEATAPFLHRIVALDRDGGTLVAETKGDANAKPDEAPYILPPEVVRARLHVPYAGYAAATMTSPYARMAVFALLVLLAAFAIVRRILRAPQAPELAAAAEPAGVGTTVAAGAATASLASSLLLVGLAFVVARAR